LDRVRERRQNRQFRLLPALSDDERVAARVPRIGWQGVAMGEIFPAEKPAEALEFTGER